MAQSNGVGTKTGARIKRRRVTPQQAKDWLKESNHDNRPMNGRTVSRYAEDMVAGVWDDTGDTIKFSGNGRLVDGQHRLAAVIQSGRSIEFWVAEGLGSNIFDKIDHGRPRRLQDCLAINQVPNAATVSGALKKLYELKEGEEARRQFWTNHRGLEYLEVHPKIVSCVSQVMAWGGRWLVTDSIASALLYLFREKDTKVGTAFMEKVLTQEGLEKNTMEMRLYRILRRAANSGDARLTKHAFYQYFIKSWNKAQGKNVKIAFIKGQPVPKIEEVAT